MVVEQEIILEPDGALIMATAGIMTLGVVHFVDGSHAGDGVLQALRVWKARYGLLNRHVKKVSPCRWPAGGGIYFA